MCVPDKQMHTLYTHICGPCQLWRPLWNATTWDVANLSTPLIRDLSVGCQQVSSTHTYGEDLLLSKGPVKPYFCLWSLHGAPKAAATGQHIIQTHISSLEHRSTTSSCQHRAVCKDVDSKCQNLQYMKCWKTKWNLTPENKIIQTSLLQWNYRNIMDYLFKSFGI